MDQRTYQEELAMERILYLQRESEQQRIAAALAQPRLWRRTARQAGRLLTALGTRLERVGQPEPQPSLTATISPSLFDR